LGGANVTVDSDGSAPSEQLLTPGAGSHNTLNFGAVHVNDRSARRISIENQGKFAFDFSWASLSAPDAASNSVLQLSPLRGTVPPGETVQCEFAFAPRREVVLDNVKFQCTVAGARKYNVVVTGQGSKPIINFSSFNLDFGPCFIAEHGVSSRTEERVLTISNQETDNPVAVDCLFEKTEVLDINCEPTVLQPGESMQVPLRFTPRELKEYKGAIPFEINGLYSVNVLYSGEGTILSLGLEEPDRGTLNFGSQRVGAHITKTFKVINRSKRAASFMLHDRVEGGQGILEQRCVTVHPAPGVPITLRPRETCAVQISFQPERRLAQFSEPLLMQVNGGEKRLIDVIGSCQGEDVKLELSSLNFGDVCESCKVTRKVQLGNAGDLGARFRVGIASEARRDYSIFPMEGFLPPHGQIMLDITFHPQVVADELRAELRVVAEGNEQSTMTLALCGTCMSIPAEGIKELRFDNVKVRESETKQIELSNPGKTAWTLQPTIHNAYWSGAPRLEIPAGGSAKYDLTFTPLTMTSGPDTDHEGSIFFALPTGAAILYKLLGKATEPGAEAEVSETTAAKKHLTIPLRVRNCFRTAQRLAVTIERMQGTDDHFFKGPRSIDVPGSGHRDYKLGFIGYREGKAEARVTFTNDKTGEYLFYIVRITIDKPGTQGTLHLDTIVRQPVTCSIRVENPFFGSQKRVQFESPEDKAKIDLAKPSCSWWSCDSPFVRVRALNDAASEREALFEVEYRPLLPTTEPSTHRLMLKSAELGEYPYELELRAKPAQTEQALNFRATLGAAHEQVFRFTHLGAGPSDYTCKVGQPLFYKVEPSLKAAAATSWLGSEVAISVRFEPQGLGEVRDLLTVASPDGGEYTCSLNGVCDPPRPQGPFTISDPAKGVSIDFRNVFSEAKEYKAIVDSDVFTVNGARSQVLKIDASKAVALVVKTAGASSAEDAPVTGKLLVSCVDMPALPAWTFYVRTARKAP